MEAAPMMMDGLPVMLTFAVFEMLGAPTLAFVLSAIFAVPLF
ncbi:MAG: hypothetical protein NTX73_05170 [Rhodobacterales bacterium]|jgi:hypothetical protein|nr:hypothetical protein [Rhodobacterales bacterium]